MSTLCVLCCEVFFCVFLFFFCGQETSCRNRKLFEPVALEECNYIKRNVVPFLHMNPNPLLNKSIKQ